MERHRQGRRYADKLATYAERATGLGRHSPEAATGTCRGIGASEDEGVDWTEETKASG
ncbi:hypothetical protein ACIQPR_36425 [Streptomyces sp. NPDC091280]|uniref:hypothetical protein n=1 Tax=Streptomyces sp. NPDC091280 TaxID=3365984 RepID=UPI0037F33A2E